MANDTRGEFPLHHDDHDTNSSGNESFARVLDKRLSRRSLLKGTAALAACTLMSGSLSGCNDSDDDDDSPKALKLNFTAVAKSVADALTVPAGYTATVLYPPGRSRSPPAWPTTATTAPTRPRPLRSAPATTTTACTLRPRRGGTYDPTRATAACWCMNHEAITPLSCTRPARRSSTACAPWPTR